MSPGALALLDIIRHHHALNELISEVEKPVVRPYRPKEADAIENSRAQWIYESGQLANHEKWFLLLTGKTEV